MESFAFVNKINMMGMLIRLAIVLLVILKQALSAEIIDADRIEFSKLNSDDFQLKCSGL